MEAEPLPYRLGALQRQVDAGRVEFFTMGQPLRQAGVRGT
jgi:hypothetical protein